MEAQFLSSPLWIVSCEERAHHRAEAQHTAHERDVVAMAKFDKVNSDLVAAGLVFFVEMDGERGEKQEEDYSHKISAEVDAFFKELDTHGWDDDKEV